MAGGGLSGSGTRAEADLFARLDEAFAHQKQLDPEVLASVRAWQRTDRTYELIQQVARGQILRLAVAEIRRTRTMRAHLDLAIASGCMPFEAVVYRGVRDLLRSTGIGCPADAVGRRIPLSGYMTTTVSRAVAVDEFTGERGVLLEISVPVGTPALWVAGVGHPMLRRQGELLLQDRIDLHVYSLGSSGHVPVLSGKVVIDE
jgi:hypothetical protein